MERGSTAFLRGAVLLIGLAVLLLCVAVLPAGIHSDAVGGYRTIFLGLYVTVVPFYIGVYQAMKLLELIDRNEAFSSHSVRALGVIGNCSLVIGCLYAAGMPFVYTVAQRDDAPGVIAIGLVIIFAAVVVAVFAALLQKLLKNAIDIKSENDLTV